MSASALRGSRRESDLRRSPGEVLEQLPGRPWARRFGHTEQMPARIAFLEHSASDVPGVLGELARALGLQVTSHRADQGAVALPDLGSVDAVVVLGSAASVHDDVAWIADERALVTAAVDADVAVLGVCFGGQLLAQVLGGTVVRASRPEIGWPAMTTSDPDRIPPGPWLDCHEDAFTCPPSAEALASTDVSLHAFISGIHTGVQFHPEATKEIVEAWIVDLRSSGFVDDAGIDALLSGFASTGRGPDDQARRLFHGFLTRAGLLD